MDQQKRNQLLDRLINDIGMKDLQQIVFNVLGPRAWNDLSGDVQRTKAISFMQRLAILRREEDLEPALNALMGEGSERDAVPERIKVLFLAANPKQTDPLRLGEEVRTIEERLRLAGLRDKFELEQGWAVRVSDLQDHLLRHRPNIVHFSGHGAEEGIFLENATGQAQPVTTRALQGLFRIIQRRADSEAERVRCVVLNACLTERVAKALAEQVDCVVGMSEEIADPASISFAAGFYRGLGEGDSVQLAFDLGCNQIDLDGWEGSGLPKILCASHINPDEVNLL